MGQSDHADDPTYSKHQELCHKLNMDATAASEAWKSYSDIRQNYTLDGEQLHWIGCALYVACRTSSTPTVGRPGVNVEGNCVSLTRLLQLCNLSLIQFFNKCKYWADMANMPQDFRRKIDKLERNFTVSMVIFKKYQPIFTDIFKNPTEENSRPPRSRRQRAPPCTPAKVFEFCWTLFICVKGAFPNISDDLVNSYHLLLACCDLVYSNALLANRKDLLNPDFPGLPERFHDDTFVPPRTANCIVNLLCDRHEAIGVEAKSIKEYALESHVTKLFNDGVLRGDQSNFSGILESLNFEGNLEAIAKAYEQHVLNVGDFDERIFLAEWRRVKLKRLASNEIVAATEDKIIGTKAKFLRRSSLKGPDASDNIGSPTKLPNSGDFHDQFQNIREQFSPMQHLAPPTPLTGRQYLKTKDAGNLPMTQSVIHLQALLAGRHAGPSENLLEMFNACPRDVKSFVESKINDISELFYANYARNPEDGDSNSIDFGKQRLILGQTLFYKLLETILNEEKRIKPNDDITKLLSNDVFLQCLFACCLQIVICSYRNNDRAFPWILQALNLEAYYFYKVIEIIVRAEQQLSRDVVIHLNHIEETILESLAWKSNSPLWNAIGMSDCGVPSCEEVSLPETLDNVDQNAPGQPALRIIARDRGNLHEVQQNPISSASERFQSPVSTSGAAKKRLFNDSRSGGQSILKEQKSQKVLTIDGTAKIVRTFFDQSGANRASNTVTMATIPSPSTTSSTKPRRTGSNALFFRKFYLLGYIRMQNLCDQLGIKETDLQKKIWTIFEYSIKDRTELMKDRHLDQILMCAVYVICKLAKIDQNTFTEIMRCYRFQPQAESHIYRSVLISRTNDRSGNDENPMEIGGVVIANRHGVAPGNMAGTAQNFGDERRGDLIKFYNEVYVPAVKDVANKLGLSRGGSITSLTLSPLPKNKPPINSPVRRVTDSVRVRTLDPKAITASPAPQLTYCFNLSPAKDLEAINRMMISVDVRKSVGKRLLSDDTDMEVSSEGQSPSKKRMSSPFLTRKLENLIGERRTQNQ